MMRRIKPAFAILLCLVLTALPACKREEPVSEYELEVLSDLTKEAGIETRLPGFSRDLCIVDPEDSYDETLIPSKYAGLFNETTKEVVYAKNTASKIYPASMTKTMTALLTVENCADLSAEVTVTEEALAGLGSGSSLAGLQAGEIMTVQDLLAAVLVPSGNDAANVLACYIGGSIEGFVGMMNARAQELGMLNTHFANANGLHDKNHYTTVYDLYLLMREFIRYPVLVDYASSKDAKGSGHLPDGSWEIHEWRSTNSISLGYTELPEGMRLLASKTGYTEMAGRCLLLAVRTSDGSDCIAVISGAASHDSLYQEMLTLLDELK